MKKIAIVITGASGSIYAKLLLERLQSLSEQIAELSIALSDNAKYVWQTELGDDGYSGFPGRYFSTKDFTAPFASGSAQYDALIIIPLFDGHAGKNRLRSFERPDYPWCRRDAERTGPAGASATGNRKPLFDIPGR